MLPESIRRMDELAAELRRKRQPKLLTEEEVDQLFEEHGVWSS